jgi:hypothetical protein
MTEGEFRDWARAQLRAMDEKLERIARERAEPAKPRPDQRVHGNIVDLSEKLLALAKENKVLAAGIVFVGDDGQTMTGWSADGGYFALAGAATFMGIQILEEFRNYEKDREAANENAESEAAHG